MLLTHPTAKLEDGAPRITDATPELEHPALAKTKASADELFSLLAAEDDETAEDDGETAQSEAALDGAVAAPARQSRSGQRLA